MIDFKQILSDYKSFKNSIIFNCNFLMNTAWLTFLLKMISLLVKMFKLNQFG